MEEDDLQVPVSVNHAWASVTHRVAAIVGSVTALVSLLWDAPPSIASLRGVLAWLAILLLRRATDWLLVRTVGEQAPIELNPEETS